VIHLDCATVLFTDKCREVARLLAARFTPSRKCNRRPAIMPTIMPTGHFPHRVREDTAPARKHPAPRGPGSGARISLLSDQRFKRAARRVPHHRKGLHRAHVEDQVGPALPLNQSVRKDLRANSETPNALDLSSARSSHARSLALLPLPIGVRRFWLPVASWGVLSARACAACVRGRGFLGFYRGLTPWIAFAVPRNVVGASRNNGT